MEQAKLGSLVVLEKVGASLPASASKSTMFPMSAGEKLPSASTVTDKNMLGGSLTPPMGVENILPAKALGGATNAGVQGLRTSKPLSK